MGPKGRQLDETTIKKLARAMVAVGEREPSQVPAGFTYLGQFIAHDLSFDRTRHVTLGANVSPAALLQGSSPALDLDSLYGAGPHDRKSADFYEPDALRLRTGRTIDPEKDGFDLPRVERAAVIPDERNDDNLAVAQTHLAFIRFHNRVVATLPDSDPSPLRFAHARELVTKHYQWMIWHDYLPRICEPAVLDDVRRNGRRVFEPAAETTAVPTMPIEFSIGTFRLGHSMVRRSYRWNRFADGDSMTLPLLFRHSAKGGNLGGRERLGGHMIADFRRLYRFGDAGRDDLAVADGSFNLAMPINTGVVSPLGELPPGTFGEAKPPADPVAANLAFRNLIRAKMVELATGQDIARLLEARSVPVPRLDPEQILEGKHGARLDRLTRQQECELLVDTPLWFYVLREAECNGGRLTGVGARIVAETFHRAIEGSCASIVRDAGWRPTLGPDSETFRMVDLLLFAFEGQLALLAPLEP